MAPTSNRAHRRQPNPNRVKIHRNYTISEVSDLFGVHKNTVSGWIRKGLPALTEQRPHLILGAELRAYLTKRRHAKKQPCGPGRIYCMRCRTPKRPAGGLADFEPLTPTNGNLIGICPTCESLMYRRVSTSKLQAVAADLALQIAEGPPHIGESNQPSVNSDFHRSRQT